MGIGIEVGWAIVLILAAATATVAATLADRAPRGSSAPLALRATLAFLLLPGVVAGLVPWFFFDQVRPRLDPAGIILIGVGLALLLWCVHEFYTAGKGTLAPWDPPKSLVVGGPYAYSRNPMYVAVLVILAGWAIAYGSWRLAAYAAGVAVAFHLRTVLHEERRLAREDPSAWAAYAASVPRWLPLRRSRRSAEGGVR